MDQIGIHYKNDICTIVPNGFKTQFNHLGWRHEMEVRLNHVDDIPYKYQCRVVDGPTMHVGEWGKAPTTALVSVLAMIAIADALRNDPKLTAKDKERIKRNIKINGALYMAIHYNSVQNCLFQHQGNEILTAIKNNRSTLTSDPINQSIADDLVTRIRNQLLIVGKEPVVMEAESIVMEAESIVMVAEPVVMVAEPAVVIVEPVVMEAESIVVEAESIVVVVEPAVVVVEPVVMVAEPAVVTVSEPIVNLMSKRRNIQDQDVQDIVDCMMKDVTQEVQQSLTKKVQLLVKTMVLVAVNESVI